LLVLTATVSSGFSTNWNSFRKAAPEKGVVVVVVTGVAVVVVLFVVLASGGEAAACDRRDDGGLGAEISGAPEVVGVEPRRPLSSFAMVAERLAAKKMTTSMVTSAHAPVIVVQ
jgi:hypothetical protein